MESITGLSLVTPPAKEPVSVADVREFIGASDQSDGFLQSLIQAARERCERVTGRALIKQTWMLTLDRLPPGGLIRLPKPPALSVAGKIVESIKYLDVTGALATWAATNYLVDATTEPATVQVAYLAIWPIIRNAQPAAIQVTFNAGYGADVGNVPAEIQERLKNYVSYCFDHRTERDEAFLDSLFMGHWYGEHV